MDELTIEKRLADLEKEVALLKAKTRGAASEKDWRRATGWAKDDPGYDEAMRIGAAWRRRENMRSIRELEREGLIDADPRHRSPDRAGPGGRSRRKAGKAA